VRYKVISSCVESATVKIYVDLDLTEKLVFFFLFQGYGNGNDGGGWDTAY